jgi:hypothetical protein
VGLFDWIQVFALDVFDQRELQHLFPRGRAHDRGNGFAPGELGRQESPLAGDQLVSGSVGIPTENDRLQEAAHPDGVRKILQA